MTGPYRSSDPDAPPEYPDLGAAPTDFYEPDGVVTRGANMILLRSIQMGAWAARITGGSIDLRFDEGWRRDHDTTEDAGNGLRTRLTIMAGVLPEHATTDMLPQNALGRIKLILGSSSNRSPMYDFSAWIRPHALVVAFEPVWIPPPPEGAAEREELSVLVSLREQARHKWSGDADMRGARADLDSCLAGCELLGEVAAQERAFCHELLADIALVQGDSLGAIENLRLGLVGIPSELPDARPLRAHLHLRLCDAQHAAGLKAAALEEANAALSLRFATHRAEHPAAIYALSCVAELEEELGLPGAAARNAEVATFAREIFGEDDPLAST